MGGGNRGSGKGGNNRWGDDAWRRDLEVCARCGAAFRKQCRTLRGKPTRPHAGRAPRASAPSAATVDRTMAEAPAVLREVRAAIEPAGVRLRGQR